MDAKELLTCALDIGELMLISGAEVGRVEDSVIRICKAYPETERIDILSITASISATIVMKDGTDATLTRRIMRYDYNLEVVHRLNSLSRKIVREKPALSGIREDIEKIKAVKKYPLWVEFLGFAMIGGPFTIFFGGSIIDALVATAVVCAVKLVLVLSEKLKFAAFLSNAFGSFVLCLLSFIIGRLMPVLNVDMVIIGCIMVLIPGIFLTNSVRDLISGDTITGLLNIAWAILMAVAIAVGFVTASIVMGGAVI